MIGTDRLGSTQYVQLYDTLRQALYVAKADIKLIFIAKLMGWKDF